MYFAVALDSIEIVAERLILVGGAVMMFVIAALSTILLWHAEHLESENISFWAWCGCQIRRYHSAEKVQGGFRCSTCGVALDNAIGDENEGYVNPLRSGYSRGRVEGFIRDDRSETYPHKGPGRL